MLFKLLHLLSIIIVNYNVKYFTEQCLFSVQKAIAGMDAEVIVVDNSSADESVAYLQEIFPWVHFIVNPSNKGYASANNRGYQLAKGATALTESWQALPSVSNNHLMLGHLMEWFYAGLCGIKVQHEAAQYRIDIKPQPVGDLTYARASYQSPYGTINSGWKRSGKSFTLDVTIPANTTATIYLPSNSTSKAPFKVGSGNYSYIVTLD